jgi:glucose-6-phosphate dehydrogenase assembly protein OpcA
MTTAIQPENILRELSDQWNQLDHDQAVSGGVLRACSMTLVVTAGDDLNAETVRRTLGVLMHEHPSRAVVLTARDGAELNARVFAECWKPFGSTQQICSEGVDLLADSASLEQAARLLVPLKVPDLPLVLWCRGPEAFHLRAFDALFPLADKLIFDSAMVPNPSAALSFLRSLRARGCRVADLHWTRLTGWRESLAHLFDDEALPASSITAVRVGYHGAAPSACALYFAAWVAHGLPNARLSLTSQDGLPGLNSVTLSTPTCEISLTKVASENASSENAGSEKAGRAIEVNGCGRSYRSFLPPVDEESLMREELNILGADVVYDRVLG